MKGELEIAVHWERLNEGTLEERACFGLLTIQQEGLFLTEGLDGFIDRARCGPLVSGYHLAEWLTWNWWRLIGEPRPERMTDDWTLAHGLATIGVGYLWPNISIFSDRERTVLTAKPTPAEGFTAFRFTADQTVVLPTRQFMAAVDRFMGQIQGQLRAEAIGPTNFDRIWDELQAERADPETAAYRKLEALLGRDPDEAPAEEIEHLFADAAGLGWDAIQELAADHQPGKPIPRMSDFTALAAKVGTETRPGDMVRLPATELFPRDQVAAWQRGYEAAGALRAACGFGLGPLSNQRLVDLVGVSAQVLVVSAPADHAFSLDDESGKAGRIVLRSKWETGRRFELARLLGDRLTTGDLNERLLPATRAYTYRQKLQRAFAAELLCPFEALEETLAGDYSPEAQEDAAEHFAVSPLTITSMLVNHRRLDRGYLDGDPEILTA
jgi:hypothetical protein